MAKVFNGSYGDWKTIQTDDGSTTLYSTFFDENCHSISGAREETVFQYIEGTNLLKHKYPKVLEIGFGTGIGFEETYKACVPKHLFFEFTSLELDEKLITYFLENKTLEEKISFDQKNNILESKTKQFHLRIIIGDARKTLKAFIGKSPKTFNSVYLDGFSPKKNPTLWTKEWLEEIKGYMEPNGVISTYCSSIGFRKAMVEAGFIIKEGGAFRKKRSSTRGYLKGESDPEIIKKLSESKTPFFKDK